VPRLAGTLALPVVAFEVFWGLGEDVEGAVWFLDLEVLGEEIVGEVSFFAIGVYFVGVVDFEGGDGGVLGGGGGADVGVLLEGVHLLDDVFGA